MVLTDIENEPDDAMSMVRFLLYSNQFNVRGLVATTSIHQKDKVADWRIKDILKAYGKVYDKLSQHEEGFPTYEDLMGKVKKGLPEYGMQGVGKGKSSEGSDWLIKELKASNEPLWVLAWGGTNCLAQSLYTMKEELSAKELNTQLQKLRVYTISDQDDCGPWIRRTFRNIFYIVSPGTWADKHDGYFYSTWSGISGEQHYHFASGADTSFVSNTWVDKYIQNGKSELGDEYPDIEYIMEGDSPSFMFLINNGLNTPSHPEYGGWGGRYELYTPNKQKWFWTPETRPIYTNAVDKVQGIDGKFYADNRATIWRWREQYQNDFAARMAWTHSKFENANHPPEPRINTSGSTVITSLDSIKISAERSIDPDNNLLNYNWFVYYEAGSTFVPGQLIISENKREATFKAPAVMKPETYHLILALTDNGEPALTRYRRIIINVNP